MRSLFSTCLQIVFVIVACGSSGNGGQRLPIDEVRTIGVQLCDLFYGDELDLLHDRFADRNYSIDKLSEFRERVADQFGKEIEILVEIPHVVAFTESNNGGLVYGYVRHSRFSKADHPVRTIFGFDRQGEIYRFEVTTLEYEAATEYSNYQTKTKLRLPFDGEWFVAWGGRTIELNQHAVASDQRFAYDFLIKRDGYSFKSDGLDNENYYCFNQEILAPGGGWIVEVVNDIPDNRHGETPQIHGNRVIIDHHNGEYSVLSHFKRGSIVVEVGSEVVSGQLLGYCGNSGHSSEPHLHYHLQDTPVIEKGNGLPAQFELYEANGREVRKGEPLIMQTVRH